MSSKKPTGIYRPILSEALRLTWSRKGLWVFGLFAGLISTGGVIDVALHAFQRVTTQGTFLQQAFDRSFVGYTWFASAIEQMQIIGSGRVVWALTAATLLCVVLWMAGVQSQIVLLLNSASTTQKPLKDLRKKVASHVWQVFLIDVLTKLSCLLLVLVASLPFTLFLLQTSVQHFWLVFLSTLLFLPLIVILNILSMLAMIDVVDHGSKTLDAIEMAWRLFRRQWMATFEFGLLLFLVVLLLGLGLVVVASLLMIPYAIIYTSALLTGSLGIFFTANILFGALFLVIILAFTGAIVMFQYTAWHRFYKRSMHKQHGAKLFSKILRWLRP